MLCFSGDSNGRHDVLFFFSFEREFCFCVSLERELCFCVSLERELCFFFFCFSVFFFFYKFRFKGNREKRSDYGSQNRAIEQRFERFPAFWI